MKSSNSKFISFSLPFYVFRFGFLVALLCARILGAILENNVYFNETSQMLQYAVDEANEKILYSAGMNLAVEVEKISYGREYAVSKRVCNLLEVIKTKFV